MFGEWRRPYRLGGAIALCRAGLSRSLALGWHRQPSATFARSHTHYNLRAALRVSPQARCVYRTSHGIRAALHNPPTPIYSQKQCKYTSKKYQIKIQLTRSRRSKQKRRLKRGQLSSRQKDDSSNFPLPTTLCEARGRARWGHMAARGVRGW